MKDYKAKLDELYLQEKDDGYKQESKLQFLSHKIFEFTTYDDEIDELFAKKMLEVIDCILNNNNFEYQENKENYINYLTMVNMPFLCDKLEWGTSIRGAWFDEGYEGEYTIGFSIKVPKEDTRKFMIQLVEWSIED